MWGLCHKKAWNKNINGMYEGFWSKSDRGLRGRAHFSQTILTRANVQSSLTDLIVWDICSPIDVIAVIVVIVVIVVILVYCLACAFIGQMRTTVEFTLCLTPCIRHVPLPLYSGCNRDKYQSEHLLMLTHTLKLFTRKLFYI